MTALGLEPWDITQMSELLAHELGLKDMADHNPVRVHQNRPVLEHLAVVELLEPEVLGWSLVSGRVDATDTLVRPSKGV